MATLHASLARAPQAMPRAADRTPDALFQGADQPEFRAFAIDVIETGDGPQPVAETLLHRTAFFALRQFDIPSRGKSAPVVLLVPPLSGHFPILLRDVVLGLLPDFRVAVLDWANVRHVPETFGRFGFEDNIRAVASSIRRIGPGAAVLALCQGGVPSLAAVADLAARAPGMDPAALILVAAPVDPLANPTAVVNLIRERSRYWYDVVPTDRVQRGCDGWGRWVYPARVQLAALQRYLALSRLNGTELARKMRRDDGADPEHFPFGDLYTSIMDIDARHFSENIDRVFLSRDLMHGRMWLGARRIDPAAIGQTALLTVEGELDDIAAPRQTSAAHGLCPAIPEPARGHLVAPGCGHFSLFHGEGWRRKVLPVVSAFIAEHAD